MFGTGESTGNIKPPSAKKKKKHATSDGKEKDDSIKKSEKSKPDVNESKQPTSVSIKK